MDLGHQTWQRSVKLPLEDGSFVNETDVLFPTSMGKDLIYGPVMPLSAIAGLVGEEAETFRPKDDIYPLLHPTMHCWTASSDLYIGCEEGHLLMVNSETLKVTVLQKMEELPLTETSKDILQISTVSLPISDVVEVLVLSPLPETGRSRLKYFTLPITLSQVSDNFYDERGRLHDELIHKLLYEVEHSLSSAVLSFESNKIYGFCSQVPYICSYLLPEEITSMMEENEKMDPISKLDQQEFCLDPEELERLNEESEEEVAKDIIYKVKKAFNSEFDAARKQKEIEIARVKEKNVRIGEIISDLELEEKVWQPVFEDCEKPERALVVEDDESLETELKKLQNSIQESTQNFDEHLKRLFERRVKAEMIINQEELKINNLVFSLLLDEELNSREQFLNNYLLKKQEEKSKSSKAIQKAKEDLDVFKEQHDILVAEDKVKQKAAGLQEMTSFLRKRLEDDEVVQHEIERVFQELLRLQEEKVKFQVNLTIQVLLKQGQVELENFQLSLEYSDAILINKNIIEDLNSVIRTSEAATRTSALNEGLGHPLNPLPLILVGLLTDFASVPNIEPMLTCEKIARERYENLLKKQKLTNISKQQAEQISILQAEVERLRMKTFPALIPM
ncbi:hypothetical protein NN561_007177 [Cricetulus griseus]